MIRLARVCAFLVLLSLSDAAHAIFRAYLSSAGSDANPCTLQLPCRLLPAALAAVDDEGEIWMMDSANFNTDTVAIGKSVSIIAVPGAVGSLVAVSGSAVEILAAGLKVALRNLVIVPLPNAGGLRGVAMLGASTLHIENCLFANLPGQAVYLQGAGRLAMTNTIIRNGGSYAVYVWNGGSAEISGSQMIDNQSGGVIAYGTSSTTTTAIVSDSIISGGTEGVYAFATVAGSTSHVYLTRSSIEGTSYALHSDNLNLGTAVVVVAGSTVMGNIHGWRQVNGGVVESSGNNTIRRNTTTSGTLTPVGVQ